MANFLFGQVKTFRKIPTVYHHRYFVKVKAFQQKKKKKEGYNLGIKGSLDIE